MRKHPVRLAVLLILAIYASILLFTCCSTKRVSRKERKELVEIGKLQKIREATRTESIQRFMRLVDSLRIFQIMKARSDSFKRAREIREHQQFI